ncbi:MAG: zinc metallopeptidase [Phycisphaeraceae bacterium]|nr:zinc metallopeptidase [Phycisphaeraceae bacterium]
MFTILQLAQNFVPAGSSGGGGGGLLSGWGLYFLFMIPPLLLGLWAQFRVKSSFARAAKVRASSGITGAEAAQMILDSHNLVGVKIEPVQGFLSDHYDPKHKVLRLSPDVYSGRSVAALGIAAHEAGHAIQDATSYGPLVIRNRIVPIAGIGSQAGIIMIIIGMFMGAAATVAGQWLMITGIVLFSAVVLFQLINLPVEFDASARAKRLLYSSNLVGQGGEAKAMNSVLSAAALTYVAATVGAIATLLYYVLIFMNSRR